jgi:hypothetical protein
MSPTGRNVQSKCHGQEAHCNMVGRQCTNDVVRGRRTRNVTSA